MSLLFMTNLIQYLLTIDEITTIADDRIYPGAADQQNVYPFIVLDEIISDDDQILSGVTSFVKKTVEIQCVALSYLECAQMDEAIRVNLNGYQNKSMGNLYIHSTRKMNNWNVYDPPDSTGSNKWVYNKFLMYDISFPIPDNVVHP